MEVIVVDDGSTDGSGARARDQGATVHVHAESQGPSAARNAGARLATGAVVVFVDADVVLPTRALVELEAPPESSTSLPASQVRE